MNVYLFDIDGTLVSTGGAGKAAMEQALAEVFGVPPSSNGVNYSGRTDCAIAADLLATHGIHATADLRERFVRTYLDLLPESLRRHPGRVLPGIADLLAELGRRGAVLGLLTGNLREGALLKLGHFGLFDHFAFGGFGDDHSCRDDVARSAVAALHAHVGQAVEPTRIWVIGDTPLDVRCARAVGARVAAVATGWHSLEELAAAEPDLLFADFSDATALLDRV